MFDLARAGDPPAGTFAVVRDCACAARPASTSRQQARPTGASRSKATVSTATLRTEPGNAASATGNAGLTTRSSTPSTRSRTGSPKASSAARSAPAGGRRRPADTAGAPPDTRTPATRRAQAAPGTGRTDTATQRPPAPGSVPGAAPAPDTRAILR